MVKIWSGQPDSNWRPSAWQADALPTELYPHEFKSAAYLKKHSQICQLSSLNILWIAGNFAIHREKLA